MVRPTAIQVGYEKEIHDQLRTSSISSSTIHDPAA